MVLSGDAEKTTDWEGKNKHKDKRLLTSFYIALANFLIPRKYLGWMVNNRGDLLGVTLKCCHNLLLIFVKYHHILISST